MTSTALPTSTPAQNLHAFYLQTVGTWPVHGPSSLYRRGTGRRNDRHVTASRNAARDAARQIAQLILAGAEHPEPEPDLVFCPPTELIYLSLLLDRKALSYSAVPSSTEDEAAMTREITTLAQTVWQALTGDHPWSHHTLEERSEAARQAQRSNELIAHYSALNSARPRWPLLNDHAYDTYEEWLKALGLTLPEEVWASVSRLDLPHKNHLTLHEHHFDHTGHPASPQPVTWPQDDLAWWTQAIGPLLRAAHKARQTSRLDQALNAPSGPLAELIDRAQSASARAQLSALRGQTRGQNPHPVESDVERKLRRWTTTRFDHESVHTGQRPPEQTNPLTELSELPDEPADEATTLNLHLMVTYLTRDSNLTLRETLNTELARQLLELGVTSQALSVCHADLRPQTRTLILWIQQLMLQGLPEVSAIGTSLELISSASPDLLSQVSLAQASTLLDRCREFSDDSLAPLTLRYLQRELLQMASALRETKSNRRIRTEVLAQTSPRPWVHLVNLPAQHSLGLIRHHRMPLSRAQLTLLIDRAEQEREPYDSARPNLIHTLSGTFLSPLTHAALHRAARAARLPQDTDALVTLATLGFTVELAQGGSSRHALIRSVTDNMKHLRRFAATWTSLGGSREAVVALIAYLGLRESNMIHRLSDHLTIHAYLDWFPAGLIHSSERLHGIVNDLTEDDITYEPRVTGQRLTPTDHALWTLANTPLPELP